jgi:flagellar hook-associated protein 2
MSNDLRIPGLVTGMDTQGTIDKILKYERVPLDRLKQKQQTMIWKQEAYRTQNTALTQLRDLAFDLKLQSSFGTKTVTSTNNQVVTATAAANAVNTSYSIEVSKLATVASNSSTAPVSIRSSITGNYLNSVTVDGSNNSFNLTVDGIQKSITLSGSDFATYTFDGSSGKTLENLATAIQTQLNGAGFVDGSGSAIPVSVKATSNHELVFYAGQKADGTPHTLTLGAVAGDNTLSGLGFNDKATTKELVGGILNVPLTIDATNQKFKITVGNGATQEISLTANTYDGTAGKTLTDLAADIQAQLVAKGITNVNTSVSNYNQIRFTPTDGSAVKLESGSSADVLGKIGFNSGAISEYPKNAINTSTSLYNQKDKFMAVINGISESSVFRFSLNGQNFQYTMGANLDTIISDINNNTAAGVKAYYDDFNDKLVFTSTKYGNNNESGAEIQIQDPNNFLAQLFKIDQTKETGGENAVVKLNGVETQRKGNTFTLNDITFNLTGVGGPATINVTTDTSAITDKVEKYINKYNEVVASIQTKLKETKASYGDKYTYYQPLSDDQKKAMTADEITNWETNAKQGILHNNDILSGSLRSMRADLTRAISTPLSITGVPLSGTIDLSTGNQFKVTLGSQTREITLDPKTYGSTEYNVFVADIQKKLDLAFGANRIKASISGNNSLVFASQNTAMTVSDASANNGLNLLGFSSGANVKAGYDRLSQIGITTGGYTEDGKLYFNKDSFKAALINNPSGVMRLLTNFESSTTLSTDTPSDIAIKKQQENASKGIFYKLYDTISLAVTNVSKEAGSTGTLSLSNNLGNQLINNSKQMQTQQDRLNKEQDRLWKVFSDMETAMSKMNNQSAYLSSMFGQTTSSSGQKSA